MKAFRKICRSLALPMAALMLWTVLPVTAVKAAMMGTDQVIEVAAASDERSRVRAFVEREEVRRQMEALGVDPEEASARLGDLSDAEISQIARHIDKDPAGQSAIAVVIGAILFVLLVLLITDLLGFTDVYPFVRAQR